MRKVFNKSLLIGLVFSTIIGVTTFAKNEREKCVIPYEGTALTEGRIINGEVDLAFLIKDLEELESLSDVVIKGKVLPESNMVLTDTNTEWVTGYTKTKIEVSDVFSGDIKVGDIIEVVEPYYEATINGQTYFITMEGYLPSIVGNEYIWLLVKHDETSEKEGLYGMYNVLMGRYPVFENYVPYSNAKQFSKSISNLDFDVLEETNTTNYRNVYQEVLNKYN